MSLRDNNLEVTIKLSKLSEEEKEEILFEVFDILLAESRVQKSVKSEKVYEEENEKS